jgi:uncharacterized protein YbjT (DUF2867 family)
MYLITGASGNIGKILAAELLSSGKEVRVISRNADKIKSLAEKGAEIAIGDLYDQEFLINAFKGVSDAFCMIPPNPKSNDFKKDQQRIVDNLFEAIKSNHVKYVVLLSSIGAHLREGAGIVDGLGYMEERFSALKEVNIVNLRPSYFMENLFGQIGIIKNMGMAGSPIKGDLKVPMVATKDIAHVAYLLLNFLQFRGHTIKYVLGPRDVSYNEVIKVIGQAIGKPDLKYTELPYEVAEKGMVESGFVSANVASLYSGLSKAINDGSALSDYQRSPLNSTPTDIEEFSHVFAHAFLSS